MRLRTITPSKDTPTANMYGESGSGKKVTINGVDVWLKGASPAYNNYKESPYNERAAYLVAKMLGFKFVPTTVLRMVDGEVASAQRWVDGTRPEYNNPPPMLHVFDFIISNYDRHCGNWLIKKSGGIWAIDNAMAFDCGHWISEGKMVRKKLSRSGRARLKKRLKLILAEPQKVHKQLDCLIGKDRTDALLERMTLMRGR